jgi:hypothetical protein
VIFGKEKGPEVISVVSKDVVFFWAGPAVRILFAPPRSPSFWELALPSGRADANQAQKAQLYRELIAATRATVSALEHARAAPKAEELRAEQQRDKPQPTQTAWAPGSMEWLAERNWNRARMAEDEGGAAPSVIGVLKGGARVPACPFAVHD